jgi:hypothetical protein
VTDAGKRGDAGAPAFVPSLAAALHDPRAALRAAAALTLNEIWKTVVDRREEARGGR